MKKPFRLVALILVSLITSQALAGNFAVDAITRSVHSQVLENMRALEYAAWSDYTLDGRSFEEYRSQVFMSCDPKVETHLSKNHCPVDRMAGLYVLGFDSNSGPFVVNTFWGSRDQASYPSQAEIDARASAVMKIIGATTFVFGMERKIREAVKINPEIQELRLETALKFFYNQALKRNPQSLVSPQQIIGNTILAARSNHMPAQYQTAETIKKVLRRLALKNLAAL